MQIISVDGTAACSSTIDHWNDGVLGNVLPSESIPSFPVLIFREHEVKAITKNQREQQT
jgi:hypothetical protein